MSSFIYYVKAIELINMILHQLELIKKTYNNKYYTIVFFLKDECFPGSFYLVYNKGLV